MKKALAMALGAVLVAGSAAPASAASQIDFSGLYRVEYLMYGNLGITNDDTIGGGNVNDSYFDHRFQGDVTFQATDEVSVVWRFRGPAGKRWGWDDYNNRGQGLNTRFVYGQVVQDWGTIRIGRLPGGAGDEFGLSTLGWAPVLDNVLTYIAPFEGSTEYDGIQYSNSWDNGFSVKAAYAKVADAWAPGNSAVNPSDDHEADRYQVEGAYMWDGGGASLNVMYLRNATADPDVNAPIPGVPPVLGVVNDFGTAPGVPGSALQVDPTGLTPNNGAWQLDRRTMWFLNPAIMHSWGAFSVHAEGKFGWGEDQFIGRDQRAGRNNRLVTRTADSDGAGFYIDFDYNYGPGRVNLAGWWVSGTDLGDTEAGDLVDIQDGNFYPLVVAYGPALADVSTTNFDARRGTKGAVGVANQGGSFINQNSGILNVTQNDNSGLAVGDALPNQFNVLDRGRGTNWNNNTDGSNHWALMLSGQHAFTDEITFNYALAYLALTNPNYRAVDRGTFTSANPQQYTARYATQDKDLGWEIDLGVNVQLLDNLAFTSTFGYMFTGDAYKQLRGYRVTDSAANATDYSVKAVWDDADDAYSWVNSLVFTF